MPKYEFECSFCRWSTVIFQHSRESHQSPDPTECEHCGEDFLTLVRYDRDIDAQLRSIQEDLMGLQDRCIELEDRDGLGEDTRDFTTYN